MRVVLEPGDTLVVELVGTDGEFTIDYGDDELTVSADLPDSSGRGDVIYCERFGDAATHLLRDIAEDALKDGNPKE